MNAVSQNCTSSSVRDVLGSGSVVRKQLGHCVGLDAVNLWLQREH